MNIPYKPFYFMRHAQADYSQGIAIGLSDVGLSDEGKLQAQRAQSLCESLLIKKIYYSPLPRAHETMQIATQNIFVPKIDSVGLKERDLGEPLNNFLHRIENEISAALANDEPILIVSHADVYAKLCNSLQLEPLNIPTAAIIHFYPLAYNWHQKMLNQSL